MPPPQPASSRRGKQERTVGGERRRDCRRREEEAEAALAKGRGGKKGVHDLASVSCSSRFSEADAARLL